MLVLNNYKKYSDTLSGPNPGFRGSGPFTFWGNLWVIAEQCDLKCLERDITPIRVKGHAIFPIFKSKIYFVSSIQVKTCVNLW